MLFHCHCFLYRRCMNFKRLVKRNFIKNVQLVGKQKACYPGFRKRSPVKAECIALDDVCMVCKGEKVYQLATKGIEMSQPADIIKDPYVFEFLGVPEKKPIMESDLERMLVKGLEDFLLELGRGFMFVGTQQRVTVNNTHYYVDMVFYNKILKAYILIELKRTKLTPDAAGQLNMYLNYYSNEVNDEGDNPPIGIILCTDKDCLTAEYALGGLSNQIFASRYTLCLPDKQLLLDEVRRVIEQNDKQNHM